MKLQELMTMHVDLSVPPIDVGECPNGMRTIFDIVGGTFAGARLQGKILGGADWLLINADRVGRLDVRSTLETTDGAYIYVQALGILVMNDKVMSSLQDGTPTQFGDTYFMTQPRFETGDKRYEWLNRVVAVAEGRTCRHGVEYRVFELVNG